MNFKNCLSLNEKILFDKSICINNGIRNCLIVTNKKIIEYNIIDNRTKNYSVYWLNRINHISLEAASENDGRWTVLAWFEGSKLLEQKAFSFDNQSDAEEAFCIISSSIHK